MFLRRFWILCRQFHLVPQAHLVNLLQIHYLLLHHPTPLRRKLHYSIPIHHLVPLPSIVHLLHSLAQHLVQLQTLYDPVIKELAEKYNKSVAQLVLRWDLQRNTIVIPNTSKLDILQEKREGVDNSLAAMAGAITLSTEYEMPTIGLGVWRTEGKLMRDVILSAIKIGYHHFDCAADYHNEAEVGEALKEAFQSGLFKREEAGGLGSQGLLMDSKQPFCWGSNFHVKMGVPQPMEENAAHSSTSAGDQHLCGLRIPTNESHSLIDCWGYNMTASHEFGGRISSITASSVFDCGLFEHNLCAFCFGDETGSNVISLIPRGLNFQSISAGGFHVCRVLENFQVFCWGKSVGISRDDVELVPMDLIILVVGGRFHACGIRSIDQGVNCWGLSLPNSVPPPNDLKVYEMAAGDYFTCGVVASKSLTPHCWGADGPWSVLPVVFFPGVCTSKECVAGFYEFKHESLGSRFCKPGNSMVCLPCSNDYLEGTYQVTSCNATSDRRCRFNYSACGSPECLSFCFLGSKSKTWRVFALQLPIFIGEVNSKEVGNDMIFFKIIKIK